MTEIRTVNGIHLSTIRKVGLYVFGKQKYIDVKQKGLEVKMFVDKNTREDEILRFELFWGIKIVKV